MPSVRRLGTRDVLSNVIVVLEVLQTTSGVVASVPYLSSVFGAVLGLARAIDKVNNDREKYVRLAKRAVDLSTHIEESLDADSAAMDEKLLTSLVDLRRLIHRIQEDVEKHLKYNSLKRLLHQSSIASTLDDHMNALDSAWRTFDTANLIALRLKLERQAVYDDQTQLRLFRWNDLRCLNVRGPYRVGSHVIGQEYEGRWGGRAVMVRTIRKPKDAKEEDHAIHVKYFSNLHHPYLAQVLGYSHPVIPERFYVMDTGVAPLMEQFRGKDTLSRLQIWLQHIVDYQNAFHYLEDQQIPVSSHHSHDRCLPSAMLNEGGRLVMDAFDFCDSNLGCFQSCLRTLMDEEHGALSPGEDFADDDDIAGHASSLLSLLRSSVGSNGKPVDVEPFIKSDMGKIWASHQFQSDVDAQWGDYGYITWNDGAETFVRLGHIYELVKPTGKISTFILRRRAGQLWDPATDYPWHADPFCHVFRRYSSDVEEPEGRLEEIAVVRTIPDDDEYRDFFWNHAESVAEHHGIALHRIVLFEETFHYAGAIFDYHDTASLTPCNQTSDGATIPEEVYFIQSPLLATGESANPWGYWSLDPDPVPGPWPALDIPGVQLICRVRSNYVRVSTFEAEVLVYLNRLRRNRQLIESPSDSPRIVEVL